jgi:hypothetical protein
MRDIRGDLQDRANLLEQQIDAAQGQFDKLVEQLTREHDSRLEGLKSGLDAVNAVIQTEDRRLGHAPSVLKAQPQLRPSQPPPQQAHTYQPLADFPIRQRSAVSAR